MPSYARVVHTTAKEVISRHGKNENVCEMYKNEKYPRAKRAELLFFIVQYANLRRSRCRSRRGGHLRGDFCGDSKSPV